MSPKIQVTPCQKQNPSDLQASICARENGVSLNCNGIIKLRVRKILSINFDGKRITPKCETFLTLCDTAAPAGFICDTELHLDDSCPILCFVDRASLYNLVNKDNLVHNFS